MGVKQGAWLEGAVVYLASREGVSWELALSASV